MIAPENKNTVGGIYNKVMKGVLLTGDHITYSNAGGSKECSS